MTPRKKPEKKISPPQEFLNEFITYFTKQPTNTFHLYKKKYPTGAILLKNKANNTTILLKPWKTRHPISWKQLTNFINKTNSYQGHEIKKYVFIHTKYRNIAKATAQDPRQNIIATLIEINFNIRQIRIFACHALDPLLLDNLLQFAQTKRYHIIHDYKQITMQ